jgi:hypothetical protein
MDDGRCLVMHTLEDSNAMRTGVSAILEWVADCCTTMSQDRVLDTFLVCMAELPRLAVSEKPNLHIAFQAFVLLAVGNHHLRFLIHCTYSNSNRVGRLIEMKQRIGTDWDLNFCSRGRATRTRKTGIYEVQERS